MKFMHLFFPLVLLMYTHASGQGIINSKLIVQPEYNGVRIKMDEKYCPLDKVDSIRFDKLKFYISGLLLLNEGAVVWEEKNSFHLMDFSATDETPVSLNIPNNITYTSLKFNLGIDSLTNVSGAMGGDLDPTKGMYWTWQNGYINFKLEGRCSRSKARNNEFQFHLGGYSYPSNSLQTIELPLSDLGNTIILYDLMKFTKDLDFSTFNQIMEPGKSAVLLSQKAAACFRSISK